MRKLEEILEEFAFCAGHPRQMMERNLSTGKKVIGCFPIYTPQPLITALDMIPMGLWGGQVTPAAAGKYNPIYTCSIMRSCMEYGMTGVYKGMSAAVMPILCDTFRGMSSGWRMGVRDIPLISFIHPQNREDEGALDFLTEEYESVKKKLEEIAGEKLSDKKLEEAIELYNVRNRLIRQFCDIANLHLDVIKPVVRHNIMKSFTFLEINTAIEMTEELIQALNAREPHEWRGKKVILTGITAEPENFLSIFEENDIAVAADDLAQESRQYRTDYPSGGTPMRRLAMQWFDMKGCSAVYSEDHRQRGKMLVKMAHEYGADCIAVCLMRFCDVEEYDYPYISKMTEETGLYCLCLEIDQSTQDNGQSKTKIQSYAEI